ncbi:HAMP domain-containing sensor histidine kinase [Nocardioides sp.]|uniref:sensor histidine kinase n=1 Tax=Nocardioides sp. TaxID=35761 RepID=UPI00262728A0|nr:HAMP domain-containing sensor histidine kinase [Nocardioides sp.]
MNGEYETPELTALRELHRITMLVNSARDLVDVLHTAAQGVIDVIGFDAVVVNMLTDQDEFEAVTVLGPPHEALIGTRNSRDALLSEVEAGEVWGQLAFVPEGSIVHDPAMASWATSEPPLEEAHAWLPGDALYAPLRAPDGQLLGILSVDLPRDGRRPGAVLCSILEMYAVQIGLAIHHARERERLAERLRLSAATHAVVQAAAGYDDLEHILSASRPALEGGFRATQVWIRLFAEASGAWEAVNLPSGLVDDLRAAISSEASHDAAGSVELLLAGVEEIASTCWQAGRILSVSRCRPDDGADLLEREVLTSVLSWLQSLGDDQVVLVPLGVADQCLGYIALNRRTGGGWTEAEEAAALDVGRELGRVISSARLRAREQELMARLEELDEYKDRVVTTIIHELKNPLSVVMGNLELAREEPDLTSRAHEAIARGADRMQTLVDDLLTLTRLREPVVELDRVTVDLSEVVAEVATLEAQGANRQGVRLDLSAVEAGVQVRSEGSELDRMVLNLVSNAIKYSGEGDVVSLSVRQDAQHVEFRCTDTGMGIRAQDMSSIFDEFDRSSSPGARAKPGSGLGLPIVRRVVQRHGGSIEVASQVGQGSSFIVRLPRA